MRTRMSLSTHVRKQTPKVSHDDDDTGQSTSLSSRGSRGMKRHEVRIERDTTLILIKVISAKRSYTVPSFYIYYNIDENFNNEKIYRNRIGFKFKQWHSLGLSDVS